MKIILNLHLQPMAPLYNVLVLSFTSILPFLFFPSPFPLPFSSPLSPSPSSLPPSLSALPLPFPLLSLLLPPLLYFVFPLSRFLHHFKSAATFLPWNWSSLTARREGSDDDDHLASSAIVFNVGKICVVGLCTNLVKF